MPNSCKSIIKRLRHNGAITQAEYDKLMRKFDGWVPCSERMPEEDGCYLVTTTGTNNDIIDIAYYTEGIWHKASQIKAWMPLPEPYKAESEDM